MTPLSVNDPDRDMDAFLDAHQAFHGSHSRHVQFEHSAAAVITRHREAAIAELIAKVEADHFRTVTDTGANPNAMVVWNALRRAAGLPGLSKDDLPAHDETRDQYVCPKGSRLLVKPAPVPFNVPTS